MKHTKSSYAAYLHSDHWKNLRKETLEVTTSCERCSMPRWLAAIVYDQDLHVHHKTYERVGREDSRDLEVLCRRCHDVETFGRSDLREPKSAICAICEQRHWDPYAEICIACCGLCGFTLALSNVYAKPVPWMNGMRVVDLLIQNLLFLLCRFPSELENVGRMARQIIPIMRKSGIE